MSKFLQYANRQDVSLLAAAGDSATINGATLQGIYAAEFTGPSVGGIPTDITEPTFYCRIADLAGVARGAVLQITTPILLADGQSKPNGATFTVSRIEPDGTGMAYLVLRLVG